MISIRTHLPEKLTPYIKSFWCLKVSNDLSDPYVEEILPDGHHEIIFNLNSKPIRKRTGSDGWLHDPSAYFTGQNRRSYLHQLSPGAVIYAVRFHPHTQNLFYDFPASLATNQLISFADVSPTDTLWHCFSESPDDTFSNLEKEFLKRVASLKALEAPFLYVDAAVQKIIREKGNVKNEVLEKITGVSARHLEKSFQRYVGLGPKQFSNIIKFSHFVTYRKNNPKKSLSECAHEAGFHDQSHLIHMSNQIIDKSPKAFFVKDNQILGSINDFFLAL